MGEVHLYTVLWNEADMLGFFFRHYDSWVDRYVVLDDGSDDGTLEILAAHPKVEVRHLERAHPESANLSLLAAQDEGWKESRGVADWVLVVDVDEHLHVLDQEPRAYLERQRDQGVTLVPSLGFDLNSRAFPDHGDHLVETIRRGRPRTAFNKLCAWNPDAVTASGLHPGRHGAEPEGTLRLPARDELMLWHYKHLDLARWNHRDTELGARRGRIDHEQGLGIHYFMTPEERAEFWADMEAESTELGGPGFVPDERAVRPLWWDGYDRVADPAAREQA
jgi:glycosyltransferase involved in cell wall biosynthesis